MTKRLAASLWALISVLLLTACGDQTPRTVEVFSVPYDARSYLPRAVQEGPILVTFLPSSIAASGFETRGLEVMNEAAVQRSQDIFTSNTGRAWREAEVYFWFGAPQGQSGRALCDGDRPDQAVRGVEETRIIAVLCIGGARKVEIHGWVSSQTAPEDEEFRLIMVNFVEGLFQNRIERD